LAIHQVLVSASRGDAVTGFALEIRALLRPLVGSEMFARHIDAGLAAEVYALNRYEREVPPGDVLIYHASIGDPDVSAFLEHRRERLVVIYHNISPAESFAPYEPEFAARLEAGRQELVRLRDRADLTLAVSAFNAADLASIGFGDVRITPLIIDPSSLRDVAADEDARRHLDAHVHGPLALYVGQLLPHKRPELLVEALHAVATYLIPEAHLVLLGPKRLPEFAAAVQRQIVELGLGAVWITGAVTRAELRAYYERADLFVTASDHEGFCVPLIEAMNFDVPIVARGTSAIPETLGAAGLILDPKDGPLVMGEAWATVVTDVHLRRRLVDAGRARLAAFDPDAARRQLLDQLAEVM
jgi:glycosyltransferase involved in cell wall biosynthesis